MEAVRYTLGLPADGNLVRIPLLSSSNPWYTLSSATTTKASTVTGTGTTAAITYASLRFLGLLVKVSSSKMWGPVQFQVVSALAQGGLQVIYGNQQGLVKPTTITNLTKSNVAWGAGHIFVPGMRDKPLLRRTQTLQVKLQSNFLTACTKVVPVISVVEAICCTVDDPQARRERVEFEQD